MIVILNSVEKRQSFLIVLEKAFWTLVFNNSRNYRTEFCSLIYYTSIFGCTCWSNRLLLSHRTVHRFADFITCLIRICYFEELFLLAMKFLMLVFDLLSEMSSQRGWQLKSTEKTFFWIKIKFKVEADGSVFYSQIFLLTRLKANLDSWYPNCNANGTTISQASRARVAANDEVRYY